MLTGHDIVCLASADWDAPLWTNKQHVMSRLAQKNRVLYVESIGLRAPTLGYTDRQRMMRRWARYRRGLTSPVPNLYVLSPLLIPFYANRLVRATSHRLLAHQVRQSIDRLHLQNPILWSYVPNAVELVGRFQEQLVVYHCVDDLSGIPRVPTRAVQDMDRRLTHLADVVITTSFPLYAAHRALNPQTFCLPNVADVQHFGRALEAATPIPALLQNLKTPLAGYVGALDDYKVDFALLDRVAAILADWTFVMIGPLDRKPPAILTRHPNILWAGSVPYQDLPSWLKAIDVALLPHRMNSYTARSYPMKYHEYLAAGRPVVSTPLPTLAASPWVIFADEPEAFSQAIQNARHTNTPVQIRQRLQEARRHTWEGMLASIDSILDNVICAKDWLHSAHASTPSDLQPEPPSPSMGYGKLDEKLKGERV